MLFHAISCYFMLFHAISCYFMLFHAISCYFAIAPGLVLCFCHERRTILSCLQNVQCIQCSPCNLEVKTRQLKKSFSNATNLGCPGSTSQKILLLGDLQTDSWCMVTCQFLQMRLDGGLEEFGMQNSTVLCFPCLSRYQRFPNLCRHLLRESLS